MFIVFNLGCLLNEMFSLSFPPRPADKYCLFAFLWQKVITVGFAALQPCTTGLHFRLPSTSGGHFTKIA